jgi:hypothetical protein
MDWDGRKGSPRGTLGHLKGEEGSRRRSEGGGKG